MDHKIIKNVVEASMFAAGRPMSMNELLRLFSEDERPERKVMKDLIDELVEEYTDRGIELVEVASGYRIQVRHHMGEWLGRLSERRPPRYSRALMETLALIAYRQPITRGDIEDVRGVSVSSNIIRTLLERGWVRIVGHRDVPGRPAMFGTSKDFLDYFNLKSLDELPSLAELKDIDSMNEELDFGSPPYEDGEDIDDRHTADGGDTQAEIEEEFGEELEHDEETEHSDDEDDAKELAESDGDEELEESEGDFEDDLEDDDNVSEEESVLDDDDSDEELDDEDENFDDDIEELDELNEASDEDVSQEQFADEDADADSESDEDESGDVDEPKTQSA